MLLVLAVVSSSLPASAQEPEEPAPAETPPEHPAMASIRTEADVATALYVASPIFIAGAVPLFIGSATSDPFWSGGGLSSWGGSSSGSSTMSNAPLVFGVLGWTSLGLGLIGLGFAIALDVDASSRHAGLSQSHVSLRVGPASVALNGRF